MEGSVLIKDEYISVECTINADRSLEFIEQILDIFELLNISDYYIEQIYKPKAGHTKTISEYRIYFGSDEDAMAFKLTWS